MYVSSFIAQGKDYYHFDSEDGIYAISRDGRKILMTARDTATGLQENEPVMRSLIYFDLNDASKHRIVEYDTAEARLSNSYSENAMVIGGAGFGTDVDRYVWVLSSRGLLLHDLQSGLTRVMDASLSTEVSKVGSVSPDGRWLAYSIYDNKKSRTAVYLVDLEQLVN